MPTDVKPARIHSVDVVRGLIMIIMALDHVRDYVGSQAISPTDVAHASTALFFTRWITHLCAPTFFLLTGTGAFFSMRRRGVGGLSRFLFTRGLWLIVLELTVLRCLGYQFNFDYHVTLLVILWALGWSMIALAAFVHLRPWLIGTIGAALIIGHNMFDGIRAASLGAFGPVWSLLHAPGIVHGGRVLVFTSYPIIPWIGVTALGFVLGQVYSWEPERRRRFLVQMGTASIAAFIALRYANVYGDASKWSTQATATRTLVSFLNVTKYPPSLLFLLMTLGPALLLLRVFDGGVPGVFKPAWTFGKVPLFYFLLHLPLIHLVAVVICQVRYGSAHWMFESPDLGSYPFTTPPGWGISLPAVYAVWIGVVLALYLPCRWYARVKERSRNPWLSYL